MSDHATTAPDPTQHIFQLATGYVISMALQLAVRVGVADHLAAGPRTAKELAAATGTNEDALYRVLRALASVGVFDEVEPKRFALTPAADILRKDSPRSVHDLVLFIADPLHLRVYADAIESLRTGRPAAEKTLGKSVFEWFAEHPEYSSTFNNAMTNMSAALIPAVLEAYDFGDIGVLVDVAGGHGQVLRSILRQHPAMRGILMDLDHVIAGSKPYIEADGVADRCQAVTGDFFKAVPPGGDAYLMKHIIHDWSDAHCRTILDLMRAKLPPQGRVLLCELVVTGEKGPTPAKLLDIEMLVVTEGGKERTEEEFAALFAASGFRLNRIVPTSRPIAMIEAVPA